MVDSGYVPTEQDRALVKQHLGNHAMLDKGYKTTVTLKQKEAEIRSKLVSEIEYDF